MVSGVLKKTNKPVLVLTMGDPAGIGPEVVLKALAVARVRKSAGFLIAGDYNCLEKTKRVLGLDLRLVRMAAGREGIQSAELRNILKGVKITKDGDRTKSACNAGPAESADDIICLDLANLPEQGLRPGRVSKACGRAAVEYIEAALNLVLSSAAGAMVTAPISKEAAHRAGFNWPGHTEFLADRAGTDDFAMMLAGKGLRVVLATTHLALARVSAGLSIEGILKKIKLTHAGLSRYFAIKKPRIAVCGLNPHCGEAGAFGTEEAEIISPAVSRARREAHIGVNGPLPADTVFYQAARGGFDAVVAMYHDQGLGPLKLLAFDEGVNITLGLPFIRTSPDHGTAFDIAGRGRADSRSMEQAIITAVVMLKNSRAFETLGVNNRQIKTSV